MGIDSDRNWGEFWNWMNSQWYTNGKVYIPNACREKQCHMHFALHPCKWPEMYERDGYLELAATNDIILVYPESDCWNAGNEVE